MWIISWHVSSPGIWYMDQNDGIEQGDFWECVLRARSLQPQEYKALCQVGPHCLNHMPGTAYEPWKVKLDIPHVWLKIDTDLKPKKPEDTNPQLLLTLVCFPCPDCSWECVYSLWSQDSWWSLPGKSEGIGESSEVTGKISIHRWWKLPVSFSGAFRSFRVSLPWKQPTIHLRCELCKNAQKSRIQPGLPGPWHLRHRGALAPHGSYHALLTIIAISMLVNKERYANEKHLTNRLNNKWEDLQDQALKCVIKLQ